MFPKRKEKPMKNKSALVALALSSVLSIGMMAGCAQETPTAGTTGDNSTVTETSIKAGVQSGVESGVSAVSDATQKISDKVQETANSDGTDASEIEGFKAKEPGNSEEGFSEKATEAATKLSEDAKDAISKTKSSFVGSESDTTVSNETA